MQPSVLGLLFLAFGLIAAGCFIYITKFLKKEKILNRILKKNKKELLPIFEKLHSHSEKIEIIFGDHQKFFGIIDHFSFKEDELVLSTFEEIPQAKVGLRCELYFNLLAEDRKERVFYKFSAVPQAITQSELFCTIRFSMPSSLEDGQKRAFLRVSPMPKSVNLVALWLRKPNQPLPRTTSEVGNPYLSSRNEDGQDCFAVDIDNISAMGLGVRVPDSEQKTILDNGEILCLMVYNESLEEERFINFCCTGRITNVRKAEGQSGMRVIGIEFTNWALLQKGDTRIHWYTLNKATGIEPILNWVQKLQKKSLQK